MSKAEIVTIDQIHKGDWVRLERVYPNGYTETFEGEVVKVEEFTLMLDVDGKSYTTWGTAATYGRTVTLYRLKRAPRPVSKGDLLEKVPIGTKVRLVMTDGTVRGGWLISAVRSARPWISGGFGNPNLEDIKEAYIVEDATNGA